MTEHDDSLRGHISYDGTRTPLKTALFLLLVLTWMLPGLVGHDPWKVDEAINFGIVREMLHSGDWVFFQLAGEPFPERAPLYLWLSALCAKLFGGLLPLHDAARLATGLFIGGICAFLAAAAYELQGERASRLAVFLFIGCIGLLIRGHEMTSDIAGVLGVAIGLYGIALAMRRAVLGGAVLGVGAGVAFLGDGFLPVGMLVMTLAMLPAVSSLWRTRGFAISIAVAIACALPLFAAWPVALALHTGTSVGAWLDYAVTARWNGPFSGEASFLYIARILPWYAWPAWPLAAWAVWRSRRTLAARRGVLVPLVAAVAFFIVATFFGESREVDAMPLLLPLAILAAAEIDAVPRGAASALDWFGVTTFALIGILVWIGWAGALTGKPDFAVAWLTREVPDFRYRFHFVAFAFALLLSLIWIVVVARSLRSPRRAVVNWTAGIAMIWMLTMTLGVPLVDQARSYRAISARVRQYIPDAHCVVRHNLGDAQRALLDYFQDIRTIAEGSPAAAKCDVMLAQASPMRVPKAQGDWEEIWRGSRPGDRNELFLLYRRR